MGDIHVHEKLKACCRKTLAELDEKKKAAKAAEGLLAVSSLVTTLGGNPVDVALGMVVDMASKSAGGRLSGSKSSAGEVEDPAARSSDIDAVLRSTCAKICELHALDHTGTEARFWQQMADGFDGGKGHAARQAREEAREQARARVNEEAEKRAEVERAQRLGRERLDEELNRSITEEYRRIEAREGTVAANRWSFDIMQRGKS